MTRIGRAASALRSSCPPRTGTHGLALLLLASVCVDAHADRTTDQAHLLAQRAATDARFEAQAADCRRRFVVTACLEDAQRQRRDALEAVRRQQFLLDETERKQRAADRIAVIRVKESAAASAAESAARQQAATPKPPTTLRLRQPSPTGRGDAAGQRPPASADAAGSGVGAPPDAATHAAPASRTGERPRSHIAPAQSSRLNRQREYSARQAEIAAHRLAVERRNAERARGEKTPAAPLPLPATRP